MKGKRPRRQRILDVVTRQIVIFAEGTRTEVDYFNYWGKANVERVQVTIDRYHGVPWSLVERAVERFREERSLRRRGVETEFWCVFDRDDHPKFREAIQRAEDVGVKVAVTNPCIELWFILHYKEQTRHIERSRARSKSSEVLRWSKKGLPTDVLRRLDERYEDAKSRAQNLDAMHEGDGRRPRSNPSSDIWKLVDSIRSY